MHGRAGTPSPGRRKGYRVHRAGSGAWVATVPRLREAKLLRVLRKEQRRVLELVEQRGADASGCPRAEATIGRQFG